MLHARIARSIVLCFIALPGASPLLAADGNRLTYLDTPDPYYVSRDFPKLTTPMWVGEAGVDAVVILSIDDMREPAKYETFIRPALQRLEQIDGKAHFSIMACKIDPNERQLQKWLAEGVSIECHTITHPCPILQGGKFAEAKKTYDDCVDLMDSIRGSRAVAFRTPCCDSKNTFSPRMLAEIFNSRTGKGNFLQIDSSVFHRFTADDPALPRPLVLDANGADRYQRYVPFSSFANDIRDYPYPYVIGKTCWEFPCVTPTDWQSNHIQGKANPQLLADWEAQLDATVIKKGTFALCFHPYGWSSPQQIVDLVDYADKKFGKRIRFLNFREALERLNTNLLGGQSLRAADGGDNGVRLLDVNNDGYLDVVIGNEKVRQTRFWDPRAGKWIEGDFPIALMEVSGGYRSETGARFGVVRPDGAASFLIASDVAAGAWSFVAGKWEIDVTLAAVLHQMPRGIRTKRDDRDEGVRLRDVDRDGICEVIESNVASQRINRLDPITHQWKKLPFNLPEGISICDPKGRDTGLRFVDIDGDGYADLVFSNDDVSAVYLFGNMKDGWNRKVIDGPRKQGDQTQLPPIVRGDGTNSGAWFLHRTMWVQNEDTATLPDFVDRRTFNSLLAKIDPIAKSPEDSSRAIQTKTGFVSELMVSEPLVESPIAIAWGPDGRMWVVEMGDYPLGLDGNGKPGGRVRILESTHNDGHYDKSTIFLDGLNFPTGVMPWGKGVLITAAPEIFYAEDTKRDGHCDLKKTLFTGFVEGNQQHRVNGLLWGLDNWVHGANGHSGGTITSFKGGEPIPLGSRDFRIRPDDGLFEPETGVSQYGHCMDDWGNWFGCDNSNPSFQFVIEDRYLRRNKFYAAPSVRVAVSNQPGAAAVYAISPTLPRFNDPFGADHFTSANSFTIYRDMLFGPAFHGNCYVSEPVHDLVHREVMHREGILFKSARADDEQASEFWASTDNWTRPTMLRTGPDGALWIVDMYRYVIEHPQWIPKDWQARLDLRAGQDKGRIYRVYPVVDLPRLQEAWQAHAGPGRVTPRPIPRLDGLDNAGLVLALDSDSGWQRDMVQQMLVQKQDKSVAPLLAKMAAESKNPLARLHGLCTLDGINALDPAVLLAALKDAEPGIRRQAVRLCEGRFDQSPRLVEALSQMVGDPDPKVRLQLACTLGECGDARAGELLGRLILQDHQDIFIAAGAFSSINDKNLDAVVRTVMAGGKQSPAPQEVVAILLKLGNGMGNAGATTTLLSAVTQSDNGKFTTAQFASLAGLLDALEASGDSLQKLAASSDPGRKAVVERLDAVFEAARAVAQDKGASFPDRAAAIGILARGSGRQAEDLKLLSAFLVPQAPDELQRAAAATLGRLRSREASKLLLAGWKGFGPSLRLQALDLLVTRDEPAGLVLDAIEQKTVLPTDIDAPHRQRLLQIKNKTLRARAAALFAEVVNPNRQKVVDAYQATMTLKGSTARGAELFAKTCSACHLLNGLGHRVGPDLASVGDKSTKGLIIAILDPNRAVEPQYVNYVAETNDGDTISGVMAAETGNSVTLRLPQGIEQTVLRANLKRLRSTGLSLMPEGLETGITPQDLADVIAFVQSTGPAPRLRTFEGNRPEVAMPSVDGALSLLPSACEIFGSKIVLEKHYGNLGFWQADDDHAVWSIQPARAGKYAVWLDYACDAASAGNTLVLQCGPERLTYHVESTGSWDTYHRLLIGEIKLGAGRQHLTARSMDKIHGALLDLRAIELYPKPE